MNLGPRIDRHVFMMNCCEFIFLFNILQVGIYLNIFQYVARCRKIKEDQFGDLQLR